MLTDMLPITTPSSGGNINIETGSIPDNTEVTILDVETKNAIGICVTLSSLPYSNDTKLGFAVVDGTLIGYFLPNTAYGSVSYTDGRLVVKAKNMSNHNYYIMYE